MTVILDRDGAKLFRGDCRDILPTITPESIDMMLVDPSYGETKLEWDIRDLSWLRIGGPLVKRTGSIWCWGSLRSFMDQAAEIRALGWWLAQEIVWEKHNGSNSASDRFRRVHEISAQFYRFDTPWDEIWKAPVTTNDATKRQIRHKGRTKHWGETGTSWYVSEDGGPRLMRSVFRVRSCHGYAVHPTQKPVGVLEPLIRFSCPPGGLVLDPMCGSGSTLVAAKGLGRRSIGIEMRSDFCDDAAREISQQMWFAA